MKLVLGAKLFFSGVSTKHEAQKGMEIIDQLHELWYDREAEFTSIIEGKHHRHSRHYVGLAFDVRIWYMPDVPKFVAIIQEQLGDDYDVVYKEGDTHIHVEFDPERKSL